MKLIEVTDKISINEFLEVPKLLYKDDPNWSCPLDIEIENTFNPDKNDCFKHGEAKRWVLKDDHDKLIGRIAAFYDMNKANHNPQPTGGTGFFECIYDQNAANLLFDSARDWLKGKGMEAMDGPVNFGENFVNWGLLVEGFTTQGYGMLYNFGYYKELYEKYGFCNYFEQYTYHDHYQYPERMIKFSDHIADKPNFTFRHFEKKNSEVFIRDLVEMYNKVWADFLENYTPMKYEDLYNIFLEAKPIIDERFVWFAYDEGKPIAFLVVFPDVNQLFRKINGKLDFWSILKILYYKQRKVITRGRLLLSGVIPEYQRSGIVGAIYLKLTRSMKAAGLNELELSWVGEYNTTVNHMYHQFGASKAKTHVTYRYLFDRNKEFVRFTNEASNKFKKNPKKD